MEWRARCNQGSTRAHTQATRRDTRVEHSAPQRGRAVAEGREGRGGGRDRCRWESLVSRGLDTDVRSMFAMFYYD